MIAGSKTGDRNEVYAEVHISHEAAIEAHRGH